LEYNSNSEDPDEHKPEPDKLNVKGARVCLNLHFLLLVY